MKAFLKSFSYAFNGFVTAIKTERNFRFHLVSATYAVVLGFLFELSRIEFILLLVVIAMVLCAELLNSAVELSREKLEPNHCEHVGLVKDIAAAAVLTNAVVAAIIGVILFFDISKLGKIGLFMIKNPVFLIIFILSLTVSYWFIFIFRKE